MLQNQKNVYYKGQYGNHTSQSRIDGTTFYFVYYSETNSTSTYQAKTAYYVATSLTSGIVTGVMYK